MKSLPVLVLLAMSIPLTAAEKKIDRFDPAFDRLVAKEAVVEKLGEGYRWSEGPVWYQNSVVFSDVPGNIAYQWKEGDKAPKVFLQPSGGEVPVGTSREPGSNGLAVDAQGRLLLCQHGARRIARYENGTFTTLVDRYEGKRFHSPNDLVVRKSGQIFFTDPPYGLEGINESPLKEQAVNGVYRLDPDGKVALLIKDLSYPNGITLSPDEKVLYVAISDSAHPRVMAYDVQPDATVANGRIFFDPKNTPELKGPGGFDGLKTDREGNVWTTGPGGVLVISAQGKLLGRINTGVPTANCGWGGEDGSTLYITANNELVRVKTLTRGAGW